MSPRHLPAAPKRPVPFTERFLCQGENSFSFQVFLYSQAALAARLRVLDVRPSHHKPHSYPSSIKPADDSITDLKAH